MGSFGILARPLLFILATGVEWPCAGIGKGAWEAIQVTGFFRVQGQAMFPQALALKILGWLVVLYGISVDF